MKRLLATLILAGLIASTAFAPTPVRADPMTIDLSSDVVEITTAFSGSDLLLFGAYELDFEGEVIVVVTGPLGLETVRRKGRVAGVWANVGEMTFADTPSFYAIASTKPLAEMLDETKLRELRIGAQNLGLEAKAVAVDAKQDEAKAYADALIRNKVKENLYSDSLHDVKKVGAHLFRTNIHMPANVHVGKYTVTTHLVDDDGELLNTQVKDIWVQKIGLEAQIYDFAHQHALAYGLLAIVIAVAAGWLANAMFRKG